MPSYRHDSTNYLLERAKPQNFGGITPPSSTHIANRVSLPYDPQEATTPGSANAIELLFAQQGESWGGGAELSAGDYNNINANDDAVGIDVLGLLRNFIQQETTSFEDQRVHDIVVDESVVDRDMYVAWTCYDSVTPKWKIMLSKFGEDGTHIATQEVADHLTYNWAGKTVTGAYSQRPKKTISLAIEPLAGGAVCLAFIQETGVAHSPGFPSAGTGSGVMILRKKKTDLTDMAADPIVEIMPPSATDSMLEVDLMHEVGSNVIHCALTRQTAGFIDSLWHGEYNVGAAAAPTVATSKLALGSALDRLGQPTIIEDAIANVYVFYGQYLNGTTEMAIKHIDHATFGTIITWHNHALSYSGIVPFAVVPINGAAGFAVVWGEDDGTSTDIVYKLKTGNASGAGGGTQTIYTRSGITESGAIYGVYEDLGAGNATFVVARFATKERPCYMVLRSIVIAATPVATYLWRQPTNAGLPVGEHFPMVYNDHADAEKLFVAGTNFDGSTGQMYLGSCSFAAVFMRMRGGTSWLATMSKLFFVASAGSNPEFGDWNHEDGCVLTVYDDGASEWVHGNSRRGKNEANSLFGLTGGSIHMDLPGSILQGGPPEEAVFVVHANSCGKLYDPILMRVGYAALMPDPEEETTIGTDPVALPSAPPNAIFHSTIERYREDIEITEWMNAVWLRAAARYAVVNGAGAIALLDGSNEINSSVAPSVHGENITNLRGAAVNPQTGIYYIIGETNQTGGNSFIGRLVPSTGKIIKMFTLADLYNDITFHTDGRCFGVVDSTSPNIGDVNTINLESGAEANLMNGNAGSGQSLAFNPNDGLLYHLSQSPPIFESIHPDTGVSTPIATSGAPVPAPTIAGFLVHESGSTFSFQTDIGGNNNWYSIDVGGAIAFVGAKATGYLGIADERTALQQTPLIGTSSVSQIAGCFYSPSQERMRLMRMELYLQRTGAVGDPHIVKIVRVYTGEDGNGEQPQEDDVVWENAIQFDGVDPAGGWFEIEITDGAELQPGAAYAIIISRDEKTASVYGATGGATPSLQRISRYGANFVDLNSVDLSNGFAETFTDIVAFAIDPTTAEKYVIGTTAESVEQFLGSIDPDGTVQFIGRLTGFTVDDMAFDDSGQAYVVMSNGSTTQPNGFATIDKGNGNIGANLVTCSIQTKHALAWQSGQIFYTVNTDADQFETIDAGVPSIAPIGQTSAPATLTPNALFWEDIASRFIVYGDGIRYHLTAGGVWTALEGKHEDIEANLHGVDRDDDGSTGGDDPANYISWSKADYYQNSEESTHSSYIKDSGSWEHNVNAMAMRLYAEVGNELVVEISRDNGTTWEEITYDTFGRRLLSAWNGVDLQEQQIYGNHTFENAATGTQLRIRYRAKGIYLNLKSISYFGK